VNQVWLQIFTLMIVGNIVKMIISYPVVGVVVDVLVLAISYLILRRYPMIDLRNSMLFLGGLTVVSILSSLGLIGEVVSNVLVVALLGWMMFGGGRNGNGGVRKSPTIRHKWHK